MQRYTDIAVKEAVIRMLSLLYKSTDILGIDTSVMDLFVENIENDDSSGEHEITRIKKAISNVICFGEADNRKLLEGASMAIFVFGEMDMLEAQDISDYIMCDLNEDFKSFIMTYCKNFDIRNTTVMIFIKEDCLTKEQIIEQYEAGDGFMNYSFEERYNDNKGDE